MSASAKAWKVQDSHDRRSNMSVSSVNAPAKKDGAGGSYTWGRAMDVVDYEPMGSTNRVVTVAAAPVAAAPVVVHQQPVTITDGAQFPSLGATLGGPTTSVLWAAPAPAVYQAPPPQVVVASSPVVTTRTAAVAAPMQVAAPVVTSGAAPSSSRVVLGEDMLRQSVESLDGTHPRNTFARKPHRVSVGAVPEQQGAVAIDWTAAGTTAFQQQVIHAVAQNPAHLGPYIEAKPGPDMGSLKVTQSPAAFVPNQKLMKLVPNQPKMGKPQVMCQRKC